MLRIWHVHTRHRRRVVAVATARRYLHRHVHHARLHALLHVRRHRSASLWLLLGCHVHGHGDHLRLLGVYLLRHVHLLLRAVRMRVAVHLSVRVRAGVHMSYMALGLHVLGGDLLGKRLHLLPGHHTHGESRRRVHYLHDLAVGSAHLHRRLHVLHSLELHVMMVLHFEHLLWRHFIWHVHLLRHVLLLLGLVVHKHVLLVHLSEHVLLLHHLLLLMLLVRVHRLVPVLRYKHRRLVMQLVLRLVGLLLLWGQVRVRRGAAVVHSLHPSCLRLWTPPAWRHRRPCRIRCIGWLEGTPRGRARSSLR